MIERAFSDWEHITPRRAQVLGLLAATHTEREIAGVVGLSVATVHRHISELRDIVGCASGRELGRWWQQAHHEWIGAMEALASCDP